MSDGMSWKLKIKGKRLPKKPIVIHVKQGDGTEPDADDTANRAHFPRAGNSSFAPGASSGGPGNRRRIRE